MADRWEDWFAPGETLIWEGAPVPGRVHWFRNVLLTCFGIPFLFGGFMSAGAGLAFLPEGRNAMNWFGAVFLFAFSVPFVTVGAAMVAGPWLMDWLTPRRTRYALSDRAGYVATRFWRRKMDVIPVLNDTRVEIEETDEGVGSVYFDFEHYRDSDGDRQTRKRGFEGIRNARDVYRLVRDLKEVQR